MIELERIKIKCKKCQEAFKFMDTEEFMDFYNKKECPECGEEFENNFYLIYADTDF
jgi:Zn finger protein HypA/HybF involved in hydrogenase expression